MTMTVSMWLTLISTLGLAILFVPAARARHHLSPPLLLLIVNMLAWNLCWLGLVRSGQLGWYWLTLFAASWVPALGMDFVLHFVGRWRSWRWLRVTSFVYFGLLAVSAASGLLVSHARYFVGIVVWRYLMVAGAVVVCGAIAWMLARHYRTQREPAERAHTRLLFLAAALWAGLAATDVVHVQVSSAVPQMSALGMLVFALLMTIVIERMRPGGQWMRWVLPYAVAFGGIAVLGNYVIFRTWGASAQLILARTVIFTLVILAMAREVMWIVGERRARMAELALFGRYTAQMAHDLKNPLAAIGGACQVLAEARRRGELTSSLHLLELVERQVGRMTSILDHYDRASRVDPSPRPVSLAGLADDVVRPVSLRHSNIVVRREDEGDLPLVAVDPELMRRALGNLVDNAIAAMEGRGQLTVAVRGRRPAAWHAEVPGVEITVSDTGPGIDPRTSERVFDDFFTTKADGSGLGLAFVRRVVEAHGGRVALRGGAGRGACFQITLPALPHHAPASQPPLSWVPNRAPHEPVSRPAMSSV